MSRLISLLLTLVLALVLATPAQATPINGSFETGNLSGWGSAGGPTVIGNLGGISPTNGAFQAFLSTEGNFTDTAFAGALGLAANAFDVANGGTNMTEGAAIAQSFSVIAGETYWVNWNFLTNEGTPSGFNDAAFVVWNGVVSLLANTSSVFSPAPGTGFAEQTGYQTLTLVAPFTGNIILAFGVLDGVDTVVDSALLVDNLQVVPEPATLTLVGLGLAAAARRLRRRRN